jgi:hypothetical protein
MALQYSVLQNNYDIAETIGSGKMNSLKADNKTKNNYL